MIRPLTDLSVGEGGTEGGSPGEYGAGEVREAVEKRVGSGISKMA